MSPAAPNVRDTAWSLPPLLLVTDRHAVHGRFGTGTGALLAALAAAVAGGVRFVQLREPDLDAASFAALADETAALLAPARGVLVVNRRLDVPLPALPPARRGRQLGMHDLAARRRDEAALAHGLVGASCHGAADVQAAAAWGADFALLGAVFATASHPGETRLLGAAEAGRIARAATMPVYAVGGVECARLPALRAAGVARVAVIRAVLAAPDPARAAGDLQAALYADAPDVA